MAAVAAAPAIPGTLLQNTNCPMFVIVNALYC